MLAMLWIVAHANDWHDNRVIYMRPMQNDGISRLVGSWQFCPC